MNNILVPLLVVAPFVVLFIVHQILLWKYGGRK